MDCPKCKNDMEFIGALGRDGCYRCEAKKIATCNEVKEPVKKKEKKK